MTDRGIPTSSQTLVTEVSCPAAGHMTDRVIPQVARYLTDWAVVATGQSHDWLRYPDKWPVTFLTELSRPVASHMTDRCTAVSDQLLTDLFPREASCMTEKGIPTSGQLPCW